MLSLRFAALTVVMTGAILIGCASVQVRPTNDAPKQVRASYYSLESMLDEAAQARDQQNAFRHAEVTSLILGHWMSDPHQAALAFPHIVAFANDSGARGMTSLLWASATAAAVYEPEDLQAAMPQLQVLLRRDRDDGDLLTVVLIDLSRNRQYRPVLIAPETARPDLLRLIIELAEGPTNDDAFVSAANAINNSLESQSIGRLQFLYGRPGESTDASMIRTVRGGLVAGLAAKRHSDLAQSNYLGQLVSPAASAGEPQLSDRFFTQFSSLATGWSVKESIEPSTNKYGGKTKVIAAGKTDTSGTVVIIVQKEYQDSSGATREILQAKWSSDGTYKSQHLQLKDDDWKVVKQKEQKGAAGIPIEEEVGSSTTTTSGSGGSDGNDGGSDGGDGDDDSGGASDSGPDGGAPDGGSDSGSDNNDDGGSDDGQDGGADGRDGDSGDSSTGASDDAEPEDTDTYPLPDDPGDVPPPTHLPGVDEYVIAIGATNDPLINPGPDYTGGIGLFIFAIPTSGDVYPIDDLPFVGPIQLIPNSIEWYFSGSQPTR